MKPVNFVAPIHLQNNVSHTRIWISGTSAVTILILIVAWFLAPPKDLQVTPHTESQLATVPDNNLTPAISGLSKPRIAEVITAVHYAVHKVEPKTLQVIELAHTPDVSLLTLLQAEAPTAAQQDELEQVIRLLRKYIPHVELMAIAATSAGSDGVRVIEMSHIRIQHT